MSLSNLANLIGQINLANQHKKEILIVNNTLNNNTFFKLLLKENLIKNYLITNKDLIIFLKYTRDNNPLIKQIKMISKPGKKVYFSKYKLMSIIYKNKCSLYFISTDLGILTGENCIKNQKGGELIFEIKL